MRLSVIVTACGWPHLLQQALNAYRVQTLSPKEWELILVEDMMVGDVSAAYSELVGNINVTHVTIDSSRSPGFLGRRAYQASPDTCQSRNQASSAVSTNVGIVLAQGRHLCLSRPEIVHAPTNFEVACQLLDKSQHYLFGITHLATKDPGAFLDAWQNGAGIGWTQLLRVAGARRVALSRGGYASAAFLSKNVATSVGGVDFENPQGSGCADDDFRGRLARAGCPTRMTSDLEVLSLEPAREMEGERRRNPPSGRTSMGKDDARHRGKHIRDTIPRSAYGGRDWTARNCIVSFRKFGLAYSLSRSSEKQGIE